MDDHSGSGKLGKHYQRGFTGGGNHSPHNCSYAQVTMHVKGDIQVRSHASGNKSEKTGQKILIYPMMGNPYRYPAPGPDIDPVDNNHHDKNQTGNLQGMPEDIYFKYFQFYKLPGSIFS